MAVAGSIINNAQSLELATRLAGQIARAATIFRVDEIVVFDDGDSSGTSFTRTGWGRDTGLETGAAFLAKVLSYLEVPQYLRRALIPMHKSLKFAGQLPPLDAPHHLRKQAWLPYREGVVLDKEIPGTTGSYVDVGLDKDIVVRERLDPGSRITVEMGPKDRLLDDGEKLNRVESSVPRESAGLYWGYTVRHVDRLTSVFRGCPYAVTALNLALLNSRIVQNEYDFCIGTSEHGDKISSCNLQIPSFRHLLVVFGGPAGLEETMELDGTAKVEHVTDLFHRYLNTCPHQGSRTIRTEEAILISLQYLQEPLLRATSQDVLTTSKGT